MIALPEYGLYAITPSGVLEQLTTWVEAVIRGGARLVQFREKSRDPARTAVAAQLLKICRDAGVPLIINDDVDLAVQITADGVHLGHTDCDVQAARAALGTSAIIGASCYASLERARTMAGNGVDYIAFGSVFSSSTKPLAPRAPLTLFSQAQELRLPIVAIGGITPENAHTVIAAGANLLAVIGGLTTTSDVSAAARTYAACFAPR